MFFGKRYEEGYAKRNNAEIACAVAQEAGFLDSRFPDCVTIVKQPPPLFFLRWG